MKACTAIIISLIVFATVISCGSFGPVVGPPTPTPLPSWTEKDAKGSFAYLENRHRVPESRGRMQRRLARNWHSSAVDDSERRRFVAVLDQGPVDLSESAVRAAIAQELKEGLEQC